MTVSAARQGLTGRSLARVAGGRGRRTGNDQAGETMNVPAKPASQENGPQALMGSVAFAKDAEAARLPGLRAEGRSGRSTTISPRMAQPQSSGRNSTAKNPCSTS